MCKMIKIIWLCLIVCAGSGYAEEWYIRDSLTDALACVDASDEASVAAYYETLWKQYEPIHGELKQWIASMERACGYNEQLGTSFKGLWQSYQICSSKYSKYLAMFARVWPYDASLGLYSVMSEGDYERAEIGIDAFMRILRAEKKKGYCGLYHFSYNTFSDSFIDPREPQGATQWVLKAFYTYMLETGDIRYLDELTGYVREDVLPLQIFDPDHSAYGLLRQGYAHPQGLAQGGYGVYEDIDKLNTVAHMVNIEHNADFIDLLRLMATCYERYHKHLENADKDFIEELRMRHALAMQASKRIRKGSHWPTAFDATGRPNWSRAIDHYTWLSHTFLDVPENGDIPWKSIKILMDEFSVVIDSMTVLFQGESKSIVLPRPAKGIFFFQQDFGDQFVAIPDEERMLLEKMIQPEATAGAICFLQDFIKHSDNAKRKKEAIVYMTELLEGLATVHEIFKEVPGYQGCGMPYATEFVFDYFGPDPSMAATATYQIALKRFQKEYANFLGVPLPKGFEFALKEEVDPKNLDEAIPVPTFGRKDNEKRTLSSKALKKMCNNIRYNGIQFYGNSLKLCMEYDEALKNHVELLVLKKTDVWYVQPESVSTGNAGFELPDSGKTETLRTFGGRGMANTMVILVEKGHGLMYNDALVDVEIASYFKQGVFMRGLTGTKSIARVFPFLDYIRPDADHEAVVTRKHRKRFWN